MDFLDDTDILEVHHYDKLSELLSEVPDALIRPDHRICLVKNVGYVPTGEKEPIDLLERDHFYVLKNDLAPSDETETFAPSKFRKEVSRIVGNI